MSHPAPAPATRLVRAVGLAMVAAVGAEVDGPDVELLAAREDNGFDLRWVAPEQRSALWQLVRKNYWGPAGTGGEFTGFEFANDNGDRLLHLERAAC